MHSHRSKMSACDEIQLPWMSCRLAKRNEAYFQVETELTARSQNWGSSEPTWAKCSARSTYHVVNIGGFATERADSRFESALAF